MTSVFFLLKNFFLCKSVLYKNFFIYLRIENNPFVVVWIVLMQPLLSKTTMKGKISKI